MARLPFVDPTACPADVRGALEALPDLNLFRMLAHAESAFTPYLSFGSAMLLELELDPALRELAILQVARSAECRYEWDQHVAIGRHAGLSEAQIAAVEQGGASEAVLSASARAVIAFADEVVRVPRPSDETFARLREHLSTRQIVELLLVIGNYLMLARLLTALDVEVDLAAASPVDG